MSLELSASVGLESEICADCCLGLLPELIPQEHFGMENPSQSSTGVWSIRWHQEGRESHEERCQF